MNYVLKHLSSEVNDLELKIQSLTLCEDVALALGIDFRTFLTDTLGVLKNLSSISVFSVYNLNSNDFKGDDADDIELIYEIKHISLDTYTSIIQGMYSNSTVNDVDIQIWTPHISYALHLIDSIANDPNHSDCALYSSCELIRNLLNTFKPNIDTSTIRTLVHEATRSPALKTKNIGMWLKQ
ncbi:hypothetical protein MXB_5010, partial [Myxobolus squamalis]